MMTSKLNAGLFLLSLMVHIWHLEFVILSGLVWSIDRYILYIDMKETIVSKKETDCVLLP